MKPTATTRKKEPDRALSQSDHAILSAVARFHYLTAAQVSRLVFPDCHDESRYARRRLARLVDAGFLLRLKSPSLRRGSVPHVYTLARAGRQLLGEDSYFRPQEEQEKARNLPFIEHTLATIDVLLAAELVCRSHPVSMPRLLVERELQARPVKVELPGPEGKPARTVAVIPDAWFELAVGTRKPLAFALELDRGSEDQRRWRGKVEALAAWAIGPYQKAFGNETLTIAVATPHDARRDQLRTWTTSELARIGQAALGEIFVFTGVDPVASPDRFFFGSCWYEPVTTEPVSLLPLPPPETTAPAPVIPLHKEVWRASP